MKAALLGYAQAGKKTLFSLLTGRSVPESRRPGESIEGFAPIRDSRVDALTALEKPERKRYADNTIVLSPDIVTGQGEVSGASARGWLESARTCDLLCVVVRAFTSGSAYHPAGQVDPLRDERNLSAELLLADMATVDRRASRLAKERQSGLTAAQAVEERALAKCQEALDQERNLSEVHFHVHERAAIRGLGLLTRKPILWVYNVDENEVATASFEGESVFIVSCRIEQEIMVLEDPEERREYLSELGLSSSGLDRMNAAIYDALGLMSFYTTGKDEVRAWTIPKGTVARKAAGKVHSDIERGFIRVEVIKYDDRIVASSEAALKAEGRAYLKGKDYVIEDGDICNFRFSV